MGGYPEDRAKTRMIEAEKREGAEGTQMIPKDLRLLGLLVRDRVTGFEGIVSSVGFDLYGCVQAVVTPRQKEGKLEDGRWFDTSRLEVLNSTPVMPVPKFAEAAEMKSAASKGGFDKPLPPGV